VYDISVGDRFTQRIGIHKGDPHYVLEVVRVTPTNIMLKVCGRGSKKANASRGKVFTMDIERVNASMIKLN